MMHMYEVQVEVEPREGCEMPSDVRGAYVNCYIPADSLRQALDRAQVVLEGDHYGVLDATYARRLRIDDWEDEEDYPTADELKSSLENEEARYGPFFAWEEDHD